MSEVPVEGLVEELMECGDSELDDRVRGLELERRRIEAELALAAGEIDRRRSYLDDGHRSLKTYLRATCNYSDAEAARVGRLTTAAIGIPGLAEALHHGHIGTPQANELAVAHSNERVRARLVDFAPMLIELAERLSFREFRTCVQRFVMLADLDGAHRDLGESMQNRRARVVNLNGSLHLDGGGGEHADEHPLPRTTAQRSYDAFAAIMRGALANHQAGRAAPGVEPVVNILTDHRTWAAILAEAGLAPDSNLVGEAVDPFTGSASPDELLAELMADPDGLASRRCETSTGQVLHPHVVLRAALAGHIRRAVLGADNLPINLGRKARVFTGPARDAAKLLAVQCDHLGCGLPADLCQVDHSIEWHEGGRTDQDNAGPRCGGHNHEKYRKRWRTKRDIHGRNHTIRADGTIMLPVGVRPPVFPDEPGDESPPPNPPIPAEVERTIDRWVDDTTDDIERCCQSLRRTAIRHAIALDGLDNGAVVRHLRVPAPPVFDPSHRTPVGTTEPPVRD